MGSSTGVATCGVVRACTLSGRAHCAGGGVRRQNVAREAHRGFKSLLASCLRPLSSKATHPPNYRSLHRPHRRRTFRGRRWLRRDELVVLGWVPLVEGHHLVIGGQLGDLGKGGCRGHASLIHGRRVAWPRGGVGGGQAAVSSISNECDHQLVCSGQAAAHDLDEGRVHLDRGDVRSLIGSYCNAAPFGFAV